MRFTPAQRAAYIDLLANQWLDGPFDSACALLVARGVEKADVEFVLREKFVIENGRWSNLRLEAEREKQREKSLAGSKGGTKSQANRQAKVKQTGKQTASKQASEIQHSVSVSVSDSVLGSNSVSPPPQTPQMAAAAELEILFKGIGLATYKRAAQMFCDKPILEVRRAIDDYRANRDKLTSPNSVVYFLENGTWPAEGVRAAADVAMSVETRRSKQFAKLRDSIRCDIAEEWKNDGRWANATETEIEAEIDNRMRARCQEKRNSKIPSLTT